MRNLILAMSFSLLAITVHAEDRVIITNPVRISTQTAVTFTPATGSTTTVTPVAGSTWSVYGVTAHDAVFSENPVGVAVLASTGAQTAVSVGDKTHIWAGLRGEIVTSEGHVAFSTPTTTNVTASGNTTVIPAPGSAYSIYLKKVYLVNSASANVQASLTVNGTSIWSAELASEGGAGVFCHSGRGYKLPANTALVVNLGGASTVDVNIMEWAIAP